MAAMMRNGNFYSLFPCDANMIQVAYEWATNSFNKAVGIVASKSALPVYLSLDEARQVTMKVQTATFVPPPRRSYDIIERLERTDGHDSQRARELMVIARADPPAEPTIARASRCGRRRDLMRLEFEDNG